MNIFFKKRTLSKKAFTLAEVLITLGIIGVVAALTLPTLIQTNKNKEVETKLQKIYSVMKQAILMSELDNGPRDTGIQNVKEVMMIQLGKLVVKLGTKNIFSLT